MIPVVDRETDEWWVPCPICNGKTRTKVRKDTVLEHFLLYCPKCRRETLIDLKGQHITIVTEPDA